MSIQEPRCPRCNAPLIPAMLDAETAPWICVPCSRGWWQAEVAATCYRVEYDDWGYGAPADAVRDAILAERETARERGTSVRADQVPLLPAFALEWLRPVIADEVTAELARRA